MADSTNESQPFSALFGFAIALILLTLYSVTVVYMIIQVVGADGNGPVVFSDGLIYVVTMIGGLIAALVVSNLAVTTPGENVFMVRLQSVSGTRTQATWEKILVGVYLLVWLGIGLAALITGVMLFPDVNQTVSDIGTTWLGLAVASGYAYFGIDARRSGGAS